jgi:hypothetical protein
MKSVLSDYPSSAEVAEVERIIRRLQQQSRMPVADYDVLFSLPIGFTMKKLQIALLLLSLRRKRLHRPSHGYLAFRDRE